MSFAEAIAIVVSFAVAKARAEAGLSAGRGGASLVPAASSATLAKTVNPAMKVAAVAAITTRKDSNEFS